jgi:catechol 2,3-dioxygenase-like lactoylglutathione lyase family enzyme
MIRGVDHIELIVRNLDEYIGFLETLGFELLTRTTHHGDSVEMGIPGQEFPIFELHQVTDEEVIGVNHIAFRVDDAGAAHEALRAAGVESAEEPGYVASTGRTNINLRDPDGWRLQLVSSDRKAPVHGPHH